MHSISNTALKVSIGVVAVIMVSHLLIAQTILYSVPQFEEQSTSDVLRAVQDLRGDLQDVKSRLQAFRSSLFQFLTLNDELKQRREYLGYLGQLSAKASEDSVGAIRARDRLFNDVKELEMMMNQEVDRSRWSDLSEEYQDSKQRFDEKLQEEGQLRAKQAQVLAEIDKERLEIERVKHELARIQQAINTF